jgi:hypothetical protein
MKTIFALLILSLSNLTALAQSYDDLIILQTDDSLFCSIKNVKNNFLKIESQSGSSVMLRVIKFVETKDENIITQLSEIVEGEMITKHQDKYHLSLEAALIPIVIKKETSFIKYKSISLFIGSQNALRYGFILFSEFPSVKNILACFEASVGVNEDYLLFSNLNVGFGVGTEYTFELISTQVFLKYYRMNLAAINYGTDLSKDFICTDFYLKYRFTQTSNYYLQLCFRFNLNSSELAGERLQNIFTAGVGLML